jgi:hypothetical protein
MKRLVDRFLFATRALVIGLSLVALVISGAGAAQRMYVDQFQPELVRTQADADVLDSKPDPAESSGGMTAPEGGRPSTEQPAWLQAVPPLASGSGKYALESGNFAGADAVWPHGGDHDRREICSSPAEVASQVARQFTLVGARPSGTS